MMKNFEKSIACIAVILIVASMTFAFMNVNNGYAQEPTTWEPPVSMWVDPLLTNVSAPAVSVGDLFNVTVWVNTAFNDTFASVFTWQVYVTYNGSLLNATRTGYTAGSTSEWFSTHTTVPVTPILTNDGVNGSVLSGESLLGADLRAPSNGSLIWIEFQILEMPDVNHSFTSTLGISNNNTSTYLLDGDLNTVSGVTFFDGEFQYWNLIPEFNPAIVVLALMTVSAALIVLRKKYALRL